MSATKCELCPEHLCRRLTISIMQQLVIVLLATSAHATKMITHTMQGESTNTHALSEALQKELATLPRTTVKSVSLPVTNNSVLLQAQTDAYFCFMESVASMDATLVGGAALEPGVKAIVTDVSDGQDSMGSEIMVFGKESRDVGRYCCQGAAESLDSEAVLEETSCVQTHKLKVVQGAKDAPGPTPCLIQDKAGVENLVFVQINNTTRRQALLQLQDMINSSTSHFVVDDQTYSELEEDGRLLLSSRTSKNSPQQVISSHGWDKFIWRP